MTYLWRGMPVKCLMKTLLGMMAKCGICPTSVWCILGRISCEWFWMLQQGFQALHWMTCFFLDPIWQTHCWEYCIDFVKTELPSYLILSVCFTRSRSLRYNVTSCASCGGLVETSPRRWLNVACTRIFGGQPVPQLSPPLLFKRQLLTMLTFLALRPWRRWGDHFTLMTVWSHCLH